MNSTLTLSVAGARPENSSHMSGNRRGFLGTHMQRNPIVNGIRYCGVVHGDEPRVFASIRLERRHTYGKHTAFGVRTKWRALSYRDLGRFDTKVAAKNAVKSVLDSKRAEAAKAERSEA